MRRPSSCAWRLTLGLAMLACVAPRAWSQPGVVNSLGDLQAAVAAGGTYTVTAPSITLYRSLTFNNSAASVLTLTGDTDACGGPCTLDGDNEGCHFVVAQGMTLRLRNLKLTRGVRGYTNGFTSEACVPAAALALTGAASGKAYWDGSALVNAGSTTDISEHCAAVVVAANASLTVSDCVFSDCGGYGRSGPTARVCARLHRPRRLAAFAQRAAARALSLAHPHARRAAQSPSCPPLRTAS